MGGSMQVRHQENGGSTKESVKASKEEKRIKRIPINANPNGDIW